MLRKLELYACLVRFWIGCELNDFMWEYGQSLKPPKCAVRVILAIVVANLIAPETGKVVIMSNIVAILGTDRASLLIF